jgi:hypothetical protein
MWLSLAEEIFFFQYHLRMDPEKCLGLPILLRKWMIDRFIKQKEDENEALERSKKSSRKS